MLTKRMKDKKEFIVSGKFHSYTYHFDGDGKLIDRLFGGYAISHITVNELLDYDLELKPIIEKQGEFTFGRNDKCVISKTAITYYKDNEPRMKVEGDKYYFMLDGEWLDLTTAYNKIRAKKVEE